MPEPNLSGPVGSRPRTVAVVTGTGTGVGKTWFGAVTLGLVRAQGHRVAARKPVQSFAPGEHPTDAEVLAAATGEAADRICLPGRSYEAPLAPPMAADVLGRPRFTIAELAAELAWPDDVAVGIVEGVGGPRSPLATDGDTVDLVERLEPDAVVVVASADLGAINAVLLTIAPFVGARSTGAAVIVALNRYDAGRVELHARNHAWLVDRAGLDVVTSPTALAERLAPPARREGSG